MTDSTFSSCAVDRPSGASPDGRMYLVNHFLDVDILGIDIPDETAASTTNGETSIMAQVDECDALYDRYPNFILVSPALVFLGGGFLALPSQLFVLLAGLGSINSEEEIPAYV